MNQFDKQFYNPPVMHCFRVDENVPLCQSNELEGYGDGITINYGEDD